MGLKNMLKKSDYMFVHKCRLCGEDFCSGSIFSNQLDIVKTMQEAICYGKMPENSPVAEVMARTLHFCESGDIGIADFIGIRKRKENGGEEKV